MIFRDGIRVHCYVAPSGGGRVVDISGPAISDLSPVETQGLVAYLSEHMETALTVAYSGKRRLPAPRPGRSLTDEVPS